MLSLRFDFRLAPHSPASMGELYAASLKMAQWADAIDGASVMFSQHHRSPDGYLPSPLVMAAAAAASTARVPITVGALLLLMYDPIKLAEDMSVLDHLSQGRVNYIIGLGYRRDEYAMFAVDSRQRGKLIEEYLDVLQQAFSGDEFQWRDRTAQVTPAPFTPGGPFRAYGGGTVAAARRAARYGMMFIPQSNAPELFVAYDEEAKLRGHQAGFYQPTPDGFPTSLFVAEDLDRAWDEIGSYLLHDARMYAQWLGAENSDTSTYSAAATVDELRQSNGAYRIVTPDQAIELYNEFGMLGLQPLSGGIAPAIAWQSLKLIEQKVLPAIKTAQA